MRRLLLSIAFVLLLTSRAWPDCSTLTPNLGLAPCTVGTNRSISDPAWINNFKLLDINAVAPLAWIGAGSISPQLTLGTVLETIGGTGQTTYIKGDTLYASATNTLSKLNGNTSTTRKFREQHGNGTAVTVDAWDTIQGPDITSGTIPASVVLGGTPAGNQCLRTDASGVIVEAGGDCIGGSPGDSILIVSTNISDANFNNTTPAAVSGKNVLWQTSGASPALVSAYVPEASTTILGVVNISTQTFAGKKTFNGGAAKVGPQGSASLTPGSITANTCSDVALGVTVQTTDTTTQAAVGDGCVLGMPAAGPGTHISATCYFSATSTAQVRFCNSNTGNQTATTGTYKVTALQ